MSVLSFINSIKDHNIKNEVRSFVIMQKGDLVAEAWFDPYGPEIPHQMFSVSKSFTSIAIGIAEAEGYFSLKDKLYDYVKEDVTDIADQIPDHAKEATIEDFLMMAVGQEDDLVNANLFQEKNWSQVFYSFEFIHKPGQVFKYNTGATYMLSVMFQKVVGMPLNDYLDQKIYQPLGIEKPYWMFCHRGYNTGGFGLRLKTRDLAKFGQLLLQEGIWEGVALIPIEYLKKATSALITGDGDAYGYQFWQNEVGGFRADGMYGQYCYVIPKRDLVIAMTCSLEDTTEVKEKILAHLIASDLKAEGKIEGLKLLGEHQVTPPSYESTYILEDNQFGFSQVAILCDKKQLVLIPDNTPAKEIVIGLDHWHSINDKIMGFKEPIRIRGVWQSESELLVQYRPIETPYVLEGVLTFITDSLIFKGQYNVGPMSQKPIEITGKLVKSQ